MVLGAAVSLLVVSLFTVRARAAGQTARRDLAVIVHPSTIEDDVSLDDLRRVFRGELTTWPGGARVVPFVQPAGTAEGDAVLRAICGMTETEFRRHWITQTFRKEPGTGPKLVSTPAMARRLTAAVPGSVALIPAADVDGTVKVLSIDHRLPGAVSYPLRLASR